MHSIPSAATLATTGRKCHALCTAVGAECIATDSPCGTKFSATDCTLQGKSHFLAWNVHYVHKDGGTRIFLPSVMPCLRETGDGMFQLTVWMFDLMQRLGLKAIQIE